MSNSLRVRCTGWPRLVTLRLTGSRRSFADLDGRIFCARRSLNAADRGADAGDQFASAEGLGDIVVGAQFERLDLLLFAVAHGKHENGQAGGEGTDAAQGFNAADAGHIDIEQDDVEAPGAQHLQSLFAARCLDHLKAELDQRRPQRSADGRFIVDEKNANHSLVHQETLFCAVAGMAAKNVVPSCSSLVTQTYPPWMTATRLATERPMPVPAARLEWVEER